MTRTLFLAITLLLSVFLAQANDHDKLMDSYNYQRGVEALNNEKYADAISYFQQEVVEHPNNGYAYYYIAYINYNYDQTGAAMEAIDKCLKVLPKKNKEWRAAANNTKGNIYLSLGDTVKALEFKTEAIKQLPNETKYWNYRGQIYNEMGKHDLALADYKKISEIEPGNGMGYLGMGREYEAMERYDEAMTMYDKAIKLNPDYAQAYSFRARCLIFQGKVDQAIEDVIAAVDSDPSISVGYHLYSLVLLGAEKQLITKLKVKGLSDTERSYLWEYYAGNVYETTGDYLHAAESYEKSNIAYPSDVTESRIANCYDELGNYDEALRHIEMAIELNPSDAVYIYKKSAIEDNAGKSVEALTSATEYINRSQNPYGFAQRGTLKQYTGDYNGALEDFNTAIILSPDVARFYLLRGRLLQSRSDMNAYKDFRKVIDLDTEPVDGSQTHYAYHFLGQDDKAKEWMVKILEDKNDKGNNYDAACLYSLMGESDMALVYLGRALDKGYREFNHMRRDHDLDAIRNLPAFKTMVTDYEHRAQAELGYTGDSGARYESVTDEIPFTREGNTYKVKCDINGLPLYFIFDTGASDVSMSNVEASFMLKNGYISRNDVMGQQSYLTASGDVTEGTIINLKEVKLGNLVLTNVRASVQRNQNAPLLLGQSALSRLGKIEIDNQRNVLRISHQVKVTEPTIIKEDEIRTQDELKATETAFGMKDNEVAFGQRDNETAFGMKDNERGTVHRNITRNTNEYVVVETGTDGSKEQVFRSVDQMPEFPGGDAALMEYLRSQIQYPPMAAQNNIQGRVVLQFVVEKTGHVGQVKVVRSVDKDLDREAVRVCKSLPQFKPGRVNGQPVNVWYTLPVTFSLGDKSKETFYPVCSSSNNKLQIQKVTVQENQTVIQFACSRDPKYTEEWIRINRDSYIEDAVGIRYKLLNAEGISIQPDVTWFGKDEQVHYFTLYFQAIPSTTSVINFKEPNDGWQILGIQLKQ